MRSVCTRVIEFLDGLRDPILVWRFQNYFGIRKKSLHINSKHQEQQSNGAAVVGQQRVSAAAAAAVAAKVIGPAGDRSDHNWNGNGKEFSHSTRNRKSKAQTWTTNSADQNRPESAKSSAQKTTTTTTTMTASDTSTDSDSSSYSSNSNSNSSSNNGRGNEAAGHEVEITKSFWYNLFSVGAALGDEAFYSSFFPFWFWNVDGAVFRRVVMIWVLVMYIGQGLKDVVRWPRPSSPPVVRLEEKWALEYGMPSTHAMVGSAIPFSFFFYTMHRYEYPVIFGLVICVVWCSLVCGSRLYLGMHTVLDIVVGLALAAALMAVSLPFVDAIDGFVLSSKASPFCVLFVNVLLIYWYPDTNVKVTRGDTVTILAVGAGVAWGSWLNFQLGIIRGPPLPPPYHILWPTYEMAGLTLLRTCIGIAIVIATRASLKSFTHAVACQVLRVRDPGGGDEDDDSSADSDSSNGRRRRRRRRLAAELSSTFVTYTAVAFNITYLSPTVFRFLNIERLTMFTEV